VHVAFYGGPSSTGHRRHSPPYFTTSNDDFLLVFICFMYLFFWRVKVFFTLDFVLTFIIVFFAVVRSSLMRVLSLLFPRLYAALSYCCHVKKQPSNEIKAKANCIPLRV
jgi:hypothetical protein